MFLFKLMPDRDQRLGDFFLSFWITFWFTTLFGFQASPGIIANPFAAGIVRKNSMESISSIDRDLSPEEIDIMQKVQDETPITIIFKLGEGGNQVMAHSSHSVNSVAQIKCKIHE